MFSWIVEFKAKILEKTNSEFLIQNNFTDLKIGQSIAHDWACMTLVEINSDFYKFFFMEETLKRTNFWNKKVGDYFNVERCLKYDDRVDWHFVTGHIDDIWTVEKIDKKADNSIVFTIKFNSKFNTLLVEKWSISVNWVSLTLVDVWNDYFTISLIPHTLEVTNLWQLKEKDLVNLEFDILWKYVQKGLNK